MTTNENSPKEEEKKEPENLYKYRSFSSPYIVSVLDGIAKDEIYFSCPTEFNDPFEGTMLINGKISNRGKYSFLLYSLSENSRNLLMWSHYSDAHTGFCIEYNNNKKNRNDKVFEMNKVSYSNDKNEITKINPNSIFDNQTSQKLIEEFGKLIKAFYTKSNDWEYEEEWRLRTYPTYGNINILIYCIFYETISTTAETRKHLINSMDTLLKDKLDSNEVIANDEKYKKFRDDFLQKLKLDLHIHLNEELHKVLLNFLSYLYEKENRIFELQKCGLKTTAIYLGIEVENNKDGDLKNIIRLLGIAQEKELKVYQMQKHSTEFKVEPKEMNSIEINAFINKLQAKIDALKNAQTLEKMKRNLQP